MPNYKWGIIGPGRIARSFAKHFSPDQTLYGVAAHQADGRAQAFADDFAIPHVYPDYAALLADPAIDIVYIATTHNFHYANIKQALQAGKHVLSEKAITLNDAELSELVALAAAKHLILMEAQTIYHMPLYPAIDTYLAEHDVGPLRTIQVAFGNKIPYHPEDRLLNPALAGGALLDIGIYALSFARRLMTATPTLLASTMVPTDTGVDDQSSMLLINANREQALVALALQTSLPNRGVAAFENGLLTIDNYSRAEGATFTPTNGNAEIISAGNTADAMKYEVDDMAAAVASGENPSLPWTVDTMALMTAARREWHFVYPGETNL